MRRSSQIVVVLSSVLSLGALRDPGNACSLLGQSEVNSVVGFTFQPGVQQGDPRICAWIEPPGPHFTNKRVELTMTDPTKFARGKTPVQAMTKTPVTGIGDDAYYAVGYGMTTLSVLKGGSAFVITVKFGTWTTDQREAMEKTLAGFVLAGL